MTNLILLLISFVIFNAYVGYIWGRYGVQKSISDSYYRLPNKTKWLFPIALWGFAFPLLPVSGPTPLFFLAIAGICFVGAAGNFMSSKMTKKVHMIGAIGGIIAGMISLWVDFHLWYLVIIMACATLLLWATGIKSRIWWVEIVAFYIIMIGLFLINFKLI